ncbi:hypothetical protein RhiLY_11088 [Ceratobasidium sp. AG-Ba]|nr:hypothetical protein RhiLY_11088 [Ceratobasidium sp. AG-Ba]
MAEPKDLGRGFRKSKITAGKRAFDEDVAKTKQSVETRKRNEKVRREEDEFQNESSPNPLPSKSPSKPKPKPKSKPTKITAQPTSKEVGPAPTPKDNGEATGDEEAANVKDLLNHEAQVDDLIFKIYALEPQPMSKLRALDLDELQVLHGRLTAAQPAPVSKAGAKPSKPAVKQPAKGATALPTTTPRKLTSSRVYTSKIQAMGSPLTAISQTQEQTARAAKMSQDTKKRPRNDSLSVGDVRRPRLEPQEPQGSDKSAVSAKQPSAARRSQSSGPSGSVSSTRAASLAPTVTSARSKLAVSSRYESIGPEDYQEAMDAIDQPEDAARRKVPVGTSDPPSKKLRVTKGTFKGTVFEKLIDFAVPFTGAVLVNNMCPEPHEYNLAILEAWEAALEYYGLSHETHTMNADHRSVIKQLFSACRSRARKSLGEGIAAEYGLLPSSTNGVEQIKKRQQILFQPPEAIGLNAGHYRRPFIARALALVWLSGTNAVGKLYPEALNPVPINAIAYLCGLTEDILTRFKRDGCIKTEKKAKKGEGNREIEGKGKGKGKGKKKGKGRATDDCSDGGSDIESEDEDFARATIDDVKAPMMRHLKGLQSFRSALKHKFIKYQKTLFENAVQCVGTGAEVEPEAESPEDGLGMEAYADEVDSESGSSSDEENGSDRREPPQPRPRYAGSSKDRASSHFSAPDSNPQRTTSSQPTPLSPVPEQDTGKLTAQGRGPKPGSNAEGDERDAEHHSTRSSSETSRPAEREYEDAKGPEEVEEEEEEEEPAPTINGGGGDSDEPSKELAATWTPRTSKVAVVASQTKRRFQPLFEDDDRAWPGDEPNDIGEDVETASGKGDDDPPAGVPDADAMDLDDQGPTNARKFMSHAGTGGEVSAGGAGAVAGSASRSESPLTSPPPARPLKRKGSETPASADPAAEDLEDGANRMRQALERLKKQGGAKSEREKSTGRLLGPGEAKPKAAKSGALSGPAANTRRRLK